MLSTSEKKNAIWNSSSFLIVSIINFIFFSVCLKFFETSLFGLYIFLQSILNIGVSLDFGFGITTIKHISEYEKRNDNFKINQFFSTFLILYFGLSLVIALVFYAYFKYFLYDSEIVTSIQYSNVYLVFIFLDITFMFTYLSLFLKSMLEGFSQFILVSKINIFVVTSNLLLLLSLFIVGFDLIYLSILNAFGGLVLCIFLLLALFRSKKELKLNFSLFNYSLLKSLFGYSFSINLSFFIGNFSDAIIKYLLGSILSLNFVAFFEAGKKIINFSSGLIVSAQKELFVKLSKENASGTLNSFVNNNLFHYSKVSNYYSIIFYGLANPVLCLMIYYWFNSFETVIIFLIFTTSYAFINFAVSLYYVLIIQGKGLKLVIIQSINITLIYVFLYISLNSFNSPIGLFGFTVATIFNVILIFWSLKKSVNLDYLKYLYKINFLDIAKLIASVILQTILLINFDQYYYHILILFTIINAILFVKYFSKIKENSNSILNRFLFKK
jgi:O-antigen/teichoic acid export membrane protein